MNRKKAAPLRWVFFATLLALAASVSTIAGPLEVTLRQYLGYTIVAVLTMTGYRDSDGSGKDGAFEGCNFGRVIIFEGNQALTCSGYGYHYAYHPDAVILAKAGDFKMLVDGEVYDMRR